MKRFFLILLLCGSAFAADIDPLTEARYQHLIEELRCLVCQNQNIAESNAPLAVDLRNQVLKMLEEGRSDSEIKDYLIARYGDFVLYRPPFKPVTWLLWVGPFLLLAIGLFVAIRNFRRSENPVTDSVDESAIAALLAEERGLKNEEEGE